VRGISIKCSQDSQAPKLIKIAVNNPNIGFDEVQDAEEPQVAQIIELDAETVTSGNVIPLRFVRFQSVLSLHVSAPKALCVPILISPVPRSSFHRTKEQKMKPG
jgi:PITH domain